MHSSLRSLTLRHVAAIVFASLAACDDVAAPVELDPGEYLESNDPVLTTQLDAQHPLDALARRPLTERATLKGSASGIMGGVAPTTTAAAVAKNDLWRATSSVARPQLATFDKVDTNVTTSFATVEGFPTTTIGTKTYSAPTAYPNDTCDPKYPAGKDLSLGNGCTSASCATSSGTVSYSNARVWSANSDWLLVGNELRHRRYGFQRIDTPCTKDTETTWAGTTVNYLRAFGKPNFFSRVQPATLFGFIRPQNKRPGPGTTTTNAGWYASGATAVDGGSATDGSESLVEPAPNGCASGSRAVFENVWKNVTCSWDATRKEATWKNLPAAVLAGVNLAKLARGKVDPATYPNVVVSGNASFQTPGRTNNRLLFTELRTDSTATAGYDFFVSHGCRRANFPMAQPPYAVGAMEKNALGAYAPILKQDKTGSGQFLERLFVYCDRPNSNSARDYSGWGAPADLRSGDDVPSYKDIVIHNAETYAASQLGTACDTDANCHAGFTCNKPDPNKKGTCVLAVDWKTFFDGTCGTDINCHLQDRLGLKKNPEFSFREFADLTRFVGEDIEDDVILDVRIESVRASDGLGDDPKNYKISVVEAPDLLNPKAYTINGRALAVSDFLVDTVNPCTESTCFDEIAVWGMHTMPGGAWIQVVFQLVKKGKDDVGSTNFLLAFARLDEFALDLAHATEIQVTTQNSHSSATRTVSGGHYYDVYVRTHSDYNPTNGTMAAVSAVLLPDERIAALHNEILPANDIVAGTTTSLAAASLEGLGAFSHISCGAAVPSDWSQWCIVSADGSQSPYGDQARSHPLKGYENGGAFGEEEVIAVDVTGVVERNSGSLVVGGPSAFVGVATSTFPFIGQIWNDRSNIAKLVWTRAADLSGQIYDLGAYANMSPDMTMVTWNSSWMPDHVIDVNRATDLDEDGDKTTRELPSRCGKDGTWTSACPSYFSGLQAQKNSTAVCDADAACIDGSMSANACTTEPICTDLPATDACALVYCVDGSDHEVLWALQSFLSAGLIPCNDGNGASGDGCSANGLVEPCTTESAICKNKAPAACSDGNTTDGDGCASEGYVEKSAVTCSDGNVEDGDGCASEGYIEKGVTACSDGNTLDGDGCESEGYKQKCSDGNSTANDGCSSGKLVEATKVAGLIWRCSMDGKSKCKLEATLTYSTGASNVFDDATESSAPTYSTVINIPSTVSCTVATTSLEVTLGSDAIGKTAGSGCGDNTTSTTCYDTLTGGARYVAWGYDVGVRVSTTLKTYTYAAPVVASTSNAGFAGTLRFGPAYGTSLVKFPVELTPSCAAYPPPSGTPADPPIGVCQTLLDTAKTYSAVTNWTVKSGTTTTALTADPLDGKQLKSGTLKFRFAENYSGTLASGYTSAAIQVVGKQARFLFSCK